MPLLSINIFTISSSFLAKDKTCLKSRIRFAVHVATYETGFDIKFHGSRFGVH